MPVRVVLLLAACCAHHCLAEKATQHWEAEADASPGCLYRNRTYAVGERWVTGPPDKCAKFLCEDDGQIAAFTCPWFIPPPGCDVSPGDKSSPYPHCCPKRSCPSGRATGTEAPSAAPAPEGTGSPSEAGTEASTAITAVTSTAGTTTTQPEGEGTEQPSSTDTLLEV